MTPYTVRLEPNCEYSVWSQGRRISAWTTKAEAEIIAWALNSVSEGNRLYSRPRVWTGEVPYHDSKYSEYRGSTEGVAPEHDDEVTPS